MSIEDLFQRTSVLNEPAVPSDVPARVAQDRRKQRRARTAVAASMLAVIAVVGAAVLVVHPRGTRALPGATVPAGWSDLPASPLSARRDARAVAVGSRAYFFGGWAGEPCPAVLGDCVSPGALLDGAWYDVETAVWHRMSNAPDELGSGGTAVVGSTIYVERDGDQALMAYDTTTDHWTDIPEPAGLQGRFYNYELVSAAGRLFSCYGGSEGYPDQVYDASRRSWSDVPPDPLGRSLLRSCAGAGGLFVVMGTRYAQDIGTAGPLYARAAAFDVASQTWNALPDSKANSTMPGWTWDGTELVQAYLEAPYQGPLPGGGRLNPVTGSWSVLPDPPSVSAAFDLRVSGLRIKAAPGNGPAYDTREQRWTTIPKAPDGVTQYPSEVWVGDALVAWGGGSHPNSRRTFATELGSSGAMYRLEPGTVHQDTASPETPHVGRTGSTTCPGTKPCYFDTNVTYELTLDGKHISGGKHTLDASRTYELELTVNASRRVSVTRYWFGESSGAIGIGGENGPTGIRFLQTGDQLTSGSPIRLQWHPAVTGHRFLSLVIEDHVAGGRTSQEGLTVGEFEISAG
ncbi:MAG: hypothetical protein JWQ07_5900 [Ramlibacter sp.]|nr:hypothetical protein [Ramlibacter sp.]